MKPDWDKLMDEFADSPYVLVAEVDCTDAQPLCTAKGVRGYPSIKWGDPSSLDDYSGGRDFDSLKLFADQKFKPKCSPRHLDVCDAEEKAKIETIMAMSASDLESAILEKEKKMAETEETFKVGVAELQVKYQQLMTVKNETLEELNVSGLGLMKAVMAAKGGNDVL